MKLDQTNLWRKRNNGFIIGFPVISIQENIDFSLIVQKNYVIKSLLDCNSETGRISEGPD